MPSPGQRGVDYAAVPTATTIRFNGELTSEDVAAIAYGAEIELGEAALAKVARNRSALEEVVAKGTPIYGLTTGFGALVDAQVTPEQYAQLQLNLLRSHAAGVGDDLPVEVVRAAMAVRLRGLLLGYSGIRAVVVERITALLNSGITPRVPSTGSLGASGDLAPSAHAFLPLVGEGEVFTPAGELIPASAALTQLGLEPLTLEAKEGLALINGTHFMAAIGALVEVRIANLMETIDGAAALTIDALEGATAAFNPSVHQLRPLPGQQASAANIAACLHGSKRTRCENDGHLQDAYSLRCAAQVHGSAREALTFFARLVAVDLNAVTDNPIVFDDPARIISAGNFHGQSLALAFDTLRIALADLASISERRLFRLLAPSINRRLPAFLTRHAGASSGYMIAQYTAAALVSELRALAHPVSVDSIPTSDNQEDHVSMGMTGALMTLKALERIETVIAFELLCAAQALDLTANKEASPVNQEIHAAVRDHVAELVDDRPPAGDVQQVLPLVKSGAIRTIVRRAREEVTA